MPRENKASKPVSFRDAIFRPKEWSPWVKAYVSNFIAGSFSGLAVWTATRWFGNGSLDAGLLAIFIIFWITIVILGAVLYSLMFGERKIFK